VVSFPQGCFFLDAVDGPSFLAFDVELDTEDESDDPAEVASFIF
jgi:hypothetical protein